MNEFILWIICGLVVTLFDYIACVRSSEHYHIREELPFIILYMVLGPIGVVIFVLFLIVEFMRTLLQNDSVQHKSAWRNTNKCVTPAAKQRDNPVVRN